MRKGLVLGITVAAFAALYAPQPLLPLLATRFEVSEATAALLVTATLLPLSFAPFSYGVLLQRVAPVRLLRAAVLALAVTEVLFALAGSFALLLGLRLVQGLLLPAIFTSLMTYVALTAPAHQRAREMAHYVAASILGGYLGRLLAGLGAAYVGWQAVFYLLAAVLLLGAATLGRLAVAQRSPPAAGAPPADLRVGWDVLRRGGFGRVYVVVFSFFFVFAALLNFLPFRLAQIEPERADLWSGLVYTGYLFGMITALGSGRISTRLGGEKRTLVIGFGVYIAALASTIAAGAWALFGALFVFCGAMFLMHAVATGLVNRTAGKRSGVVNGLYLVFYYGGGVLGSFLPGLVYERAGWVAFVCVLLTVAVAGWGVAASLPARGATPAAAARDPELVT